MIESLIRNGYLTGEIGMQEFVQTKKLDLVWDLVGCEVPWHNPAVPQHGFRYVPDSNFGAQMQNGFHQVDGWSIRTCGVNLDVPQHIVFTTYEDTTPLTSRPSVFHDHAESNWFSDVYEFSERVTYPAPPW